MFARLVRWLGQWFASPTRQPAPDNDIGAYI
jgi:hypothetical protein